MRGDICDLYIASLEYDIQRLPIVANRAGRTDRSRPHVSFVSLAALLAARGAARDPIPRMEHDDVGLGRLVLCRRLRGDHGCRPYDPATRSRFLYRRCD